MPAPDAHTRVPNLIFDTVIPLLPASERECLLYIVRRTYGFADPSNEANGGRKARDVISIDQFCNGITTGDYLLDLGTGLAKNTVKAALKSLAEKELVDVRFNCKSCFWEGPTAADDSRTKAPACPRCTTSLGRSYALAELRPSKIVDLLNEYDKQGRAWEWDKRARRFRFENVDGKQLRKQSDEDLRNELIRVRALLWHADLVDECVAKAELQLKGKMKLSRRLNNFYKVVWELQQEYPNPPLIKYGLKQTLGSSALSRPRNHRWYRYLEVVIKNNRSKYGGGADDEESTRVDDIAGREQAMYQLLSKTAQLNGSGQLEEARALLSDILAESKRLAPLFDDDEAACDRALRLAFKQGSSDFLDATVDPHARDYYPEWSPEDPAQAS